MKKIITDIELQSQLEEQPVVKKFNDVISNMQGGAGGLAGIIFCGACGQVPLPGPPPYDKAKEFCIEIGGTCNASNCPSCMYNLLKCKSYEDCLAALLMLELGKCMEEFSRCETGQDSSGHDLDGFSRAGACGASILCVASMKDALGKIKKLPECGAGEPPPPCCFPVNPWPGPNFGVGGKRNLDCQMKNIEGLSDSDFEKFWDTFYKALHESGRAPIVSGDGDPAIGGTPGIYEQEIKNPPIRLDTQSKREYIRQLYKRIYPLLRY